MASLNVKIQNVLMSMMVRSEVDYSVLIDVKMYI